MNFEEVLKKVKAGTATDEERAFFENRMAEARSALSGKKPLDFDEALSHVQDGTATEEEREYVTSRLADATAFLSGSAAEETHEKAVLDEKNAAEEDILDESAEEECAPESEENSALEFEDALEHV